MASEILVYPNPILTQVADPVVQIDDQLCKFMDDLEVTMRAGPGAVGIAAPQVGRLIRAVIIDVSARKKVKSHGKLFLVNPEITDWDGYVIGREGCLSVPDYLGNVIRAERVVVEALNLQGNRVRFEFEGYEARVAQHEIDHLDGMLFIDRLVSKRSDLYLRKKS